MRRKARSGGILRQGSAIVRAAAKSEIAVRPHDRDPASLPKQVRKRFLCFVTKVCAANGSDSAGWKHRAERRFGWAVQSDRKLRCLAPTLHERLTDAVVPDQFRIRNSVARSERPTTAAVQHRGRTPVADFSLGNETEDEILHRR